MRAIDADPDHVGGSPGPEANPFDEDPGAFRASRHQIVRPFETDVGRAEVSSSTRQRHAGDKAELRRHRRRTGIDHEGAGVKVTLGRHPDAATASFPGGLFIGDDPKAAGVAGKRAAARVLVGRIDHNVPNEAPVSMRTIRTRGDDQKSDCAAAIAALVIGEGKNTNKIIMSAESASTIRATGPGWSNAAAGSSKYMSLTILR
jgi:hypothetical protein